MWGLWLGGCKLVKDSREVPCKLTKRSEPESMTQERNCSAARKPRLEVAAPSRVLGFRVQGLGFVKGLGVRV